LVRALRGSCAPFARLMRTWCAARAHFCADHPSKLMRNKTSSAVNEGALSPTSNLLKAALAEPAKVPTKFVVAPHRHTILMLAQKHFTQKQIAGFLLKHAGVRIHRAAIGRYLQNHPPTEAETLEIERLLSGAEHQQDPPALPSLSVEALSAKPNNGDMQPGRQRTASRGTLRQQFNQRQRTPKREEEEDKTDYSFLNMEGRPFTIKEDED
jgi:hypothetical protein